MIQRRKQKTLISRVTELLRKEINDSTHSYLAPMGELAAKWKASIWTVSKAANMLCKEGVISCRAGQRIKILGKDRMEQAVPPASRDMAAKRLFSKYREAIAQGQLTAGMFLPKIAAITSENHVSNTTVIKAFRQLEEQGLLHHKGKAWIVGPAQPFRKFLNSQASDSPVIVMLMPNESAWLGLVYQRTAAFYFSFSEEARRHNVSIAAAFTQHNDKFPSAVLYTGRDGLHALLRSLGARCLGIIVIGSLETIPDLSDWFSYLLSFNKRIVWFDSYDEGSVNHPVHPLFARCHFDETAGLRLAIERLRTAGHESAVYPYSKDEIDGWKGKRFERLRDAGRDMGLLLTPLIIDRAEESKEMPEGILAHPTAVAKADRFIRKLIGNPEITAIISPHDYSAFHLYNQLLEHRIAIPERFTILSFDNAHRLAMFPVSSVDFGFGRLGYMAFHFLLGIIKISPRSDGGIAAVPFIEERGSIGPPRIRSVIQNPAM